MDRKNRIRDIIRKKGIIRPRDVEAEGIPKTYLYRMYRDGEIIRIGRGLYSFENEARSESISFAEVAKRVPQGVICLLSALRFHGLTTQTPHKVWLAIPNKKWKPVLSYPPLEIIRLTGDGFEYGIEKHRIDRVTVKVYSPSKTVADCFKFRNRIGNAIAIEALKDAWRNRMVTMDELWHSAKICRMTNVMKPYLETLS